MHFPCKHHISLTYLFLGFLISACAAILALKSFRNRAFGDMSTVTEFVGGSVVSPHPYRLFDVWDYRFVHQVGEFLVRRDNHQFIMPGLARSWDISADRHAVTFHLRTPLYSAEEVAQSLRRMLAYGQTTHSNFGDEVSSIEVVNTDTLILRTNGDAGALLSPLTMADAAILPDDHWIKDADGKDIVDWRKTRGLYRVIEGDFPVGNAKTLLLAPNPNHYLYDSQQVKWRVRHIPRGTIKSLADLKILMDSTPGFWTNLNTPLSKIIMSQPADPNDPNYVPYFDTKPNGVGFLLLNLKQGVFREKKYRIELLRRIFASEIPLGRGQSRAYQIPQEGLVGRSDDQLIDEFREHLKSLPVIEFPKQLVLRVPSDMNRNPGWLVDLLKRASIPFETLSAPGFVDSPLFSTPNLDLQFMNVGMSDMDPISGATFMFSPDGAGRDLPDGSILRSLNAVKGSTDREVIRKTVQKAFWTALTEGIVVPLYHAGNRHYHSKNVQLNISDPFSESIRIVDVRMKD